MRVRYHALCLSGTQKARTVAGGCTLKTDTYLFGGMPSHLPALSLRRAKLQLLALSRGIVGSIWSCTLTGALLNDPAARSAQHSRQITRYGWCHAPTITYRRLRIYAAREA